MLAWPNFRMLVPPKQKQQGWLAVADLVWRRQEVIVCLFTADHAESLHGEQSGFDGLHQPNVVLLLGR